MIYPNSIPADGNSQARCLRNALGSCGGCNIAQIAIGMVRWDGLSLDVAEERIKKEYCPSGVHPDITPLINQDACYTLGARRSENLEGLRAIPRLGWLARR